MRTAHPATGAGLTNYNDRGATPMTGLIKRIWLLLYTEGGKWTEAEIRRKLRVDREIHANLREMADRGFVVRSEVTDIDGESSVKYGVQRRCKVPRGVTIDEMWEVLQMSTRQPQPA